MVAFILYMLIIGAGTGGELCIARGMKVVGEVKDFRPLALLSLIPRILRVPWMWAGVGLMATAFFSLLAILARQNVSMVVPVTALSYGAGALGGKLFLNERVTPRRWAGVLLVCVGVALVIVGRS